MGLDELQVAQDRGYVKERLYVVVQEVRLDLKRRTIADTNRLTSRIKRLIRWGLINFGAEVQKINAKDINRIATVVNALDTRATFYTAARDEIPEWVLNSVQEARQELRCVSGDVWADRESEYIIQKINHYLADFCTAISRLKPMPQNHHQANWPVFERELIDLRLRIWCLIAALKKRYGSVINPLHLPHEIDDLISTRSP